MCGVTAGTLLAGVWLTANAAWVVVGLVAGVLLSTGVSWWVINRHGRRVRIAERRALAAERMAEIGAMTGGLAHEIKNPLSTIGLNAQLLAEAIGELQLDEDERGRLTRRVEALGREVDRLRGILEDFLEYAGEIRLVPATVDLNVVVEELVDFFHPQVVSHGIRFRFDPAPGPMPATIDAAQLKQAILNLMLNAVQAMKPMDDDRPHELIVQTARVTAPDGRPELVVRVTDTGPGMDDATASKLFEPYFTTRSGGTGLGLPTARRIVELHGGHISVHTEPGRGTSFSVALPA